MPTFFSPFATLIAVSILPWQLVVAQQPSPVMEFSSVLSSLDVQHQDGRLQLEDDNAALATAFLPHGAKFDVVISEAGSDEPLFVQPMAVSQPFAIFNRVAARGNSREFKFSKPGNYVATYRADGKPMTVVPFEIEFVKNGDEFDPKTHVYANGPWSEFAYLFASVNDGAEANLQVCFWVRKKSFDPNPEADRYTVELRKDGDVIAQSEGGSSNSKKWQFMRLRLKHPDSKGGRELKVKELADGQYDVMVMRNNELHAAFQFDFSDGKPQFHPRQASDYQPRTEYIVPRFPGLLGVQGDDSAGHIIWMERLSDSDAASIADAAPKAAAAVSGEQKARWNWIPRSIDPNRPFQLSITDVETRNDTGLAAGEDLIVFGTGFPNGVKYIKVGDTQPREIPGGDTYNAKVFGVCGTKIVLVKKNQVAVYDTSTEKLTEIPASDVTLYNVSQQLLATNGFLVGIVNRATSVSDGTIVKIIDVSGDQPKIIPIKNSDYLDSQVTSIAVDAKNGTMAVSSSSQKLIAAAKIAPLANQMVFDATDYQGVGPQAIFNEDDWIAYPDADWKVRLLNLESGDSKAITDQPFPRAGNGFFVRQGRLAVASTAHKSGSRYGFEVGDLPAAPRMVPGTGDPIEGTSGGLGMAGCAAIAVDKTVFIAGTPGDRIDKGEHLQILDDENGKWIPVVGADSKPVAASDVTTSMGLLAFKVLTDAGKTVIGYATYGQRVDYVNAAASVATPSTASSSSGSTANLKPIEFEEENFYVTQDEKTDAVLNGLLENEAVMLEALAAALGEAAAKKQIVDNIVMSLKSQGNDDLIDEYKRRSICVAEADKPKGADESETSDADPRSVAAALAGQWRPLRFVKSGDDLPDDAQQAVRLTFADDKYVMIMGGDVETGTWSIDTSAKPFQMTIEVASGPQKGQTRHGIFKLLVDDRLLVAVSNGSVKQPERFTSTQENGQILAAYQRVK